jgi:hypothetical protein
MTGRGPCGSWRRGGPRRARRPAGLSFTAGRLCRLCLAAGKITLGGRAGGLLCGVVPLAALVGQLLAGAGQVLGQPVPVALGGPCRLGGVAGLASGGIPLGERRVTGLLSDLEGVGVGGVIADAREREPGRCLRCRECCGLLGLADALAVRGLETVG